MLRLLRTIRKLPRTRMNMSRSTPKPLLLFVGLCLLVAPAHGQAPAAKEAEAGWQALQAGDADRAATAFYTALRRSPRDPVLHFGAGAAAYLLGRERDAVVSLNRALELEPRLIQAAELLGQITYQQGDIDAAIRIYEQAFSHASGSQAMRTRLEEWKKEATVHHTLIERNDGRFTIAFDGRANEALATHTIAVLNAAFWRIGRAMGAYPSDRILVTLYTEQQFWDTTRVPPWTGGLFDGKIRVPVGGASGNLQQLDRVLTHELTHAMVYGLAQRGIPAWLHEGLASHFEPRDPVLAQRRIASLGVSFPLAELQDTFSRFTEAQAVVAYDESLIATDVLMRLIGARVALLLQGMGRGQTFEQSLGQVGVRPSDFDAQLMLRLKH